MQLLNESIYKAVEKARVEEMHKKIKEEVIAKLSAEFSNECAQKVVVLKNELAVEKAALKRTRKKV